MSKMKENHSNIFTCHMGGLLWCGFDIEMTNSNSMGNSIYKQLSQNGRGETNRSAYSR